MKIGLYDVDSKIPNLALMKLSAYHKQNGDSVKWWNAFEQFDKIYASKIFTQTDGGYIPKDAILGGSGVSLTSELPEEIEHIYPDYSLYNINYAIGYLTRGCNNNCPFCIVHQKEGYIHKHADLEEFWSGQKKVMLLDNSLTEYKEAAAIFQKFIDLDIKINLTQGFNARTLTPKLAELITQTKLWNGQTWHIAWDYIQDEKRVFQGIQYLEDAGLSDFKHKLTCYVLVNYNSTFEEDLYRVEKLWEKKINPYVMPYGIVSDIRIKKLASWANSPQRRNSCSFEEYFDYKQPSFEQYNINEDFSNIFPMT